MNKAMIGGLATVGIFLMASYCSRAIAATIDVDDARLGPAPGTYTIKDDRDKVILPFTFFGMNLMVDARMNGVDIKMLIDNGVMWDELLFYGSDQVDRLGMQLEGSVRVTGAGDDSSKGTESYTASNASISFDDVTFHGQSAVITPKDSGWAEYFPGVAGQVCGAFFKHFIVEFNFDKQIVILHRPETYNYQGHGSAVKMSRNEGGGYTIPIKIKPRNKAEINDRLSIDLGGINPVALVIIEKYGFDKSNSEKIYLGHGASGEITGYRDYLQTLTIGNYELEEVLTVFTESDDGSNHTNTTIGLPLLMRFNLVFDYFHQTLYLQPNSHFNDPY